MIDQSKDQLKNSKQLPKSSKQLPKNSLTRSGAHVLIRFYQLTLSSVMGRHCRYLPTCSDYMDEAIQRHGLWAGGWMGLSRLCRCHPWGGSGYDPVRHDLPQAAGPLMPWRYGEWRSSRICEAVEPHAPDQEGRGG